MITNKLSLGSSFSFQLSWTRNLPWIRNKNTEIAINIEPKQQAIDSMTLKKKI